MDTEPRRLRALTIVAVIGTLVVAAVFGSMAVRGRGVDVQYGLFLFHNGPPAVLMFWLGRLVLVRQPGNRVGAVMVAIAVLGALHVAVAALADVALVDWGYTAAIGMDHPLVPRDLPLRASVPLWVMNWLWVPQVVLLITVLPLVFPDGRLPGRRWRWVLWLAGLGGTTVTAATVVDAWPTSGYGVGTTHASVVVLMPAGGLVLLVAALGSFSGLALRWRRATGEVRHQFRVVGVAVGGLALIALATYPWPEVWVPSVLVAMYLLITAYALAAARFGVHDLEPVLGKPAVAGGLAALAALAYLGVVVGAGVAVARRSDEVGLPLVGVAAAAVLAEPVRRLARRRIDRLLLRVATDRTEVVSRLAHDAAASTSDDALLREVVTLLHRGTGADRVEACLADGPHLEVVAAAGRERPGPPPLTAPLVSQGQSLGELRLYARVAADLSPDAAQVLTDATYVLGTAVHNSRLAEQLRAQLAALQASRRRIVEAQDTARRSLERDLHDGAQAQLISLRLRVGALQATLDGAEDPAAVTGVELGTLAAEIDAAVATLRNLARGLHSPLLDQGGPVAALRAHARSLPLPVTVRGEVAPRPDPAVESAVYLACLEALQNALRHSGAGRIDVEVRGLGNELRFEVSDDGGGFDPAVAEPGLGLTSMEDRVAALGGTLTVDSGPGRGTRVRGRIPLTPAGSPPPAARLPH